MNTNNNALRMLRRAPTRALIVAIGLAPIAALAGTINFAADTIGSASWGGSCGSNCAVLDLSGTSKLSGLDSYFGPSGTPAFTFSAQLDLTGFGLGAVGIGGPPSGGWSLWDGSGDSLFGSVTGWFAPTGTNTAMAGFYYDVTGGSGLFNAASGAGGSLAFYQSSGKYSEDGDFLVSTSRPVHVPEPGTLSLFAAAFAALGWSVRRRRRGIARAA